VPESNPIWEMGVGINLFLTFICYTSEHTNSTKLIWLHCILSFHDSDYDGYYLLQCDAVIFQRDILWPSSRSKSKPTKQSTTSQETAPWKHLWPALSYNRFHPNWTNWTLQNYLHLVHAVLMFIT
jgi:hypothetical protein